jgi:predicted DNA-binding transcriptional regulator YafY
VDRILELVMLSQSYKIPVDFDIHAYFKEEAKDQPKVCVRMRFTPQAAFIASRNRSYWEIYIEQSDGAVVVTFSAPDLNWAASTVMAYGPSVTVLEPPELRQVLSEWAQSIAVLYKSEEKDNIKGENHVYKA